MNRTLRSPPSPSVRKATQEVKARLTSQVIVASEQSERLKAAPWCCSISVVCKCRRAAGLGLPHNWVHGGRWRLGSALSDPAYWFCTEFDGAFGNVGTADG